MTRSSFRIKPIIGILGLAAVALFCLMALGGPSQQTAVMPVESQPAGLVQSTGVGEPLQAAVTGCVGFAESAGTHLIAISTQGVTAVVALPAAYLDIGKQPVLAAILMVALVLAAIGMLAYKITMHSSWARRKLRGIRDAVSESPTIIPRATGRLRMPPAPAAVPLR